MPKLYRHTATVDCESAFPVDMLRYDRCCPATEQDAHAITRSITREDRTCRVTVIADTPDRRPPWTAARWASFRARLTHAANSPTPIAI